MGEFKPFWWRFKSWACSGMFSSENEDFKFLKKAAKNTKACASRASHSSRARGTVLPLQISLSLSRNMNVKVDIELYYIFSKISKFRYW